MMSCLVSLEGLKVPLLGVKVVGEVVADKAHVTVRQQYRNGEAKPIEAIYTFPLPSDATLVGFEMTCAGRRLAGVVKERDEAFRAYDDALVAGHGAALLEQERPNVFTASVGNLLPGEETVIEVSYVQRLAVDEGALRWMLPTLVAPRYIPGKAGGDRTGHGAADPTAVVPDADRITPKIGAAFYGLEIDVVFDLGARVSVESPSHRVVTSDEGTRTRVRFVQPTVALDRDVVLTARGAGETTSGVTIHAPGGGEAPTLALSVVPDLGAGRAAPRQDVVFVIDTSGSMDGASIHEARAALRLCLRHLREGDRFNVIAFASGHRSFAPAMVPFTQRTLEDADRWVHALVASGGTEMLAPLVEAARLAAGGVVVLLTDGQVGNEDQILAEVLAARGPARIYAFGIGTNVSDALLRELARRSGGGLEMIHPGERIDEKVVATFARAVAPRVADVKVSFSGVEVGELAPAELPALCDGEPWALFGRLPAGADRRGGRVELRGTLDGQPFFLAVPIEPEAYAERPVLVKMWAAERVRDLEAMEVTGRRAGRMKERIVELAVRHGIASRYTSFIVVEERQGDRRSSGFPEARPIPVNLPAGWDMFQRRPEPAHVTRAGVLMGGMPSVPMPPQIPAPMGAPIPMTATVAGVGNVRDFLGATGYGGPVPPPPPRAAGGGGVFEKAKEAVKSVLAKKGRARREELEDAKAEEAAPPHDGIVELLGQQLASGLWGHGDDAARVRATAAALLRLRDEGITTGHALYGGQLKKAVEALLSLADALAPTQRRVAEQAVCAAWLVASGRRTRAGVERRLVALGLDVGDAAGIEARART